MAIDFNGTSTKLEQGTVSLPSGDAMTIAFWAYADGLGEGSVGRIISLPENGASSVRFNSSNVMELRWDWTGGGSTDGNWTWSWTTGAWHATVIRYDKSATTNDPTVRVDFAAATVTETITPSGSAAAGTGGYTIGNIQNQSVTWDGAIEHFQFFNVILTDSEADACMLRPGSIRRGLRAWHRLYHATDLTDVGGVLVSTLTATSAGTRDGSPHAPLFAGNYFGWRGNFTASAVTAKPWLYYSRQMSA